MRVGNYVIQFAAYTESIHKLYARGWVTGALLQSSPLCRRNFRLSGKPGDLYGGPDLDLERHIVANRRLLILHLGDKGTHRLQFGARFFAIHLDFILAKIGLDAVFDDERAAIFFDHSLEFEAGSVGRNLAPVYKQTNKTVTNKLLKLWPYFGTTWRRPRLPKPPLSARYRSGTIRRLSIPA